MIYPNSNLPTVSQAWGRAIQKGIETLEATVNSNDINNRARDAQLQANYVQTNKNIQDIKFALTSSGIAVTGVNEIKDAIYVPGTTQINGSSIQTGTLSASKITTGTLSGDRITGGTITGTTITGATLSTSGSRHVEVSGTNVNFYDSSGNYSGKISAAADGRSSTVEINTTSGSGIIAYNGGVDINGPGTNISSGNNGNGSILLLASGGVDVSGALRTTSTAAVSGTLTVSGSCDFNGGYARVGNGFLQVPDTRTRSTTGGLAMFVAPNGTYHVGSSSRRYKTDIENYSVDIDKLLSMQPITFRYKSEIEEVGDAAGYTTGFIAEDFDDAGLTEYVVYSEDKNGQMIPEGIQYEKLCVGLQTVAAKQQQTIDSLIARIEALESKV
jgi:hypothetical protein